MVWTMLFRMKSMLQRQERLSDGSSQVSLPSGPLSCASAGAEWRCSSPMYLADKPQADERILNCSPWGFNYLMSNCTLILHWNRYTCSIPFHLNPSFTYAKPAMLCQRCTNECIGRVIIRVLVFYKCNKKIQIFRYKYRFL